MAKKKFIGPQNLNSSTSSLEYKLQRQDFRTLSQIFHCMESLQETILKNKEKLKLLNEIPQIPRVDSQQMMTEGLTMRSIIKSSAKPCVRPPEPLDKRDSDALRLQTGKNNPCLTPSAMSQDLVAKETKKIKKGKGNKGVLYLKKRRQKADPGCIQIDNLN